MAEKTTDRADRYVSQPGAFVWLSNSRACLTCRHKHEKRNTCEVFPKRIDKEILQGSECSEFVAATDNEETT